MAAAGAAITLAASTTLRPSNTCSAIQTMPATWEELMGIEYPDGPLTAKESWMLPRSMVVASTPVSRRSVGTLRRCRPPIRSKGARSPIRDSCLGLVEDEMCAAPEFQDGEAVPFEDSPHAVAYEETVGGRDVVDPESHVADRECRSLVFSHLFSPPLGLVHCRSRKMIRENAASTRNALIEAAGKS